MEKSIKILDLNSKKMEWKEMLAKHEKDFAEFNDTMLALWMKNQKEGEKGPASVADFQKKYKELYASFMDEIYKEAQFSYQKVTLQQSEKDSLKKYIEQYPEVSYFRDRYSEMTGIDHSIRKYKEDKEIDKDER